MNYLRKLAVAFSGICMLALASAILLPLKPAVADYFYGDGPYAYCYVQGTWTSTTKSVGIIGPKSKKGTIIDVGFQNVTTTFAGATNFPLLEVGTATSSTGEYAYFGTSTGWSAGALTAATPSTFRSTNRKTDAAWLTTMTNDILAADTVFYLNILPAAGGGAAGVSDACVWVRWDL